MEGGARTLGIIKKTELNLPLVTIITVVLNGESFLEQTINSVLNQTYTNIEYIIIDGGSKDKTLTIINKFKNKIDYWISEPDNGLYFAMNKGIGLANGDLIGILNADDYYEPNAISQIINSYLKTNAAILHGDIILESNKSKIRMKPDFNKMMQQPSIFHPTCFVKKEVYNKINCFNTSYKISADYDFLLRCIKNNFKFEYVPEIITHFRPGGMSASCASNIEGYKIMKYHKTGFHQQVIWRTIKCYIKTFIKKVIN